MRVFVRSNFVDLRAERYAAAEALRRSTLVPWGMELFVSEPSSPLEVCLRELRLSDAVILITGFYAGSLIPEAHGLTCTGAEFQLAQQLGRPVLAFFKTEGGKPLNKEADASKRKALEDFRAAVTAAKITPAYFDTPESAKGRPAAGNGKVECGRPPRRPPRLHHAQGNSSPSLNLLHPGSSTSGRPCKAATHRLQR